MNLSWYVPKANVVYAIIGQGTAVSTLDHSATTPRAKLNFFAAVHVMSRSGDIVLG